MDENSTLTANPALVISLKSLKIDLIESVFVVALNANLFCGFFKTAANVQI